MTFTVELGERSYDVVVGDGAIDELKALIARRAPRARVAAIVTSESLANEPWFEIDSGIEQFVVSVPDGESAKSLAVLEGLVEELAQRRMSRDDLVIGVGGGAVTDLAGFAAAVYLRGIALVQVPTSLVGQVDAAIGGKTGVNLASGKNLVGAFHQPIGVLCDTRVLSTLSMREQRSGLGEIAKCWLLERRDAASLAATSQSSLIEMAVALKSRIVGSDEREGGSRVLLNYGHTLAHALEKFALQRDSDELRHGEAVAVGLAFAVRLAYALELVGDDAITYHDAVLNALGLNGHLPENSDTAELLDAMSFDKKARHDLSFVLDGPSGYALVAGIDRSVVEEALERFKGES